MSVGRFVPYFVSCMTESTPDDVSWTTWLLQQSNIISWDWSREGAWLLTISCWLASMASLAASHCRWGRECSEYFTQHTQSSKHCSASLFLQISSGDRLHGHDNRRPFGSGPADAWLTISWCGRWTKDASQQWSDAGKTHDWSTRQWVRAADLYYITFIHTKVH